jgi:hypothetical protein
MRKSKGEKERRKNEYKRERMDEKKQNGRIPNFAVGQRRETPRPAHPPGASEGWLAVEVPSAWAGFSTVPSSGPLVRSTRLVPPFRDLTLTSL